MERDYIKERPYYTKKELYKKGLYRKKMSFEISFI